MEGRLDLVETSYTASSGHCSGPQGRCNERKSLPQGSARSEVLIESYIFFILLLYVLELSSNSGKLFSSIQNIGAKVSSLTGSVSALGKSLI